MNEQDNIGGFALLLVAVGMPVVLLVMAAVAVAADRIGRARRAAADVNARILHHPDQAAGLARLAAAVYEQQEGDQA